jgi:F420-dependent oxidoreductase-like protein
MDVSIMIEGQNGLTWARWRRIARAVEDLGFAGLFRSDHFTNASAPDRESLELWTSLTWLATNTSRVRFGPLVTPCSFRHPVMTARMAAAVDELSGGRLTLGLGAGWQEREHTNFGFDLLPPRARFDRFEESVEIITRLFRSPAPLTYEGRHYRLREAVLLPRPRPGGPPILIGGNGARRTLRLAARFSVEWNATFQPVARWTELSRHLDELLREDGRDPAGVRRSMMTGIVFGRRPADVERHLKARGRSRDELRARGAIVGTPEEIPDQLGALDAAGLQEVMLQWLDLDDLDSLEVLARVVLKGH